MNLVERMQRTVRAVGRVAIPVVASAVHYFAGPAAGTIFEFVSRASVRDRGPKRTRWGWQISIGPCFRRGLSWRKHLYKPSGLCRRCWLTRRVGA